MPLKTYGILKGTAIEVRPGTGQNPHYQVYIVRRHDGLSHRCQRPVEALAVRTGIPDRRPVQPSDLVLLEKMLAGFTKTASEPGTSALDYIRGNLFDRTKMRPLPPKTPLSYGSAAGCEAKP